MWEQILLKQKQQRNIIAIPCYKKFITKQNKNLCYYYVFGNLSVNKFYKQNQFKTNKINVEK